jgi:hypothetical protein
MLTIPAALLLPVALWELSDSPAEAEPSPKEWLAAAVLLPVTRSVWRAEPLDSTAKGSKSLVEVPVCPRAAPVSRLAALFPLAWIPTEPHGPNGFPGQVPLFPACLPNCYRTMLS